MAFEELIGILEPSVNRPLTDRLLRHVTDDNVGAVILYIDSPGGTVSSTPELAEAVHRVAQKKPIHVIAEGYLCSGAIWVASQATSISASPSTLIGSIGVVFILVDDSELFRNSGVKVIAVTSSDLKVVGTPGVEVTQEHIAALQRLLDVTFSQFEVAISSGRKLTGERLAAVTTGDVWLATGAQKRGLIDRVELFNDAMDRIVASHPVEKYATLSGAAAHSQFLELAAVGFGDDDRPLDLDDVLPSTQSRLAKQYPTLAGEARQYESTRRRPSAYRPRF